MPNGCAKISRLYAVNLARVLHGDQPPLPFDHPRHRPVAEPLSVELLEPERARVFLVPGRADAAFDAELAALDRRTRVVGEVDRWRIHLVDGAPRGPF